MEIKNRRTGAVMWEGETLAGVDLRGRSFISADLKNQDMTASNLSGCDFSDADLAGADLTGSDLTRTCIRRADLESANKTRFYVVSGAFYGLNHQKILEKEQALPAPPLLTQKR